MADHQGWYPPGQVCYPPELPVYLKNVKDLQPIVGVPNDDEVIAIHTVIHAANGLRVSGVPGMYDSSLFVKLADHLFSVQMARYQNRYSRIMFPSDATYTPPALPAHISVRLESVSGTPSDDEIMKVQDAIQTYQELRRIPSMFDTHVNMELSQHLFDIQMARYMRRASESEPNIISTNPRIPVPTTEPVPIMTDEFERVASTNNAGTGADATRIHRVSQLAPGIDTPMERANQLAERFNVLLERSNELAERSTPPVQQPNSLDERFNQVLERLSQLVERSNQSVQQFNQHAERYNQLAEKANELTERLALSSERSNQLAEQCNNSVQSMRDVMRNINKVLVKVQHAIVRSHRDNTIEAVDCLVNETGETPGNNKITKTVSLAWLSRQYSSTTFTTPLSVMINGSFKHLCIPNDWLGSFLCLYDIGKELFEPGTTKLMTGNEANARKVLKYYLCSCLG